MIRQGLSIFTRLALLIACLAVVSCGSGSVGTSVNDPTKITILPDNATLYSGLPTTFSITGGTGAYVVTSSNQAIVPVATTLTNSTMTVVPNPVSSDTTLTISARDTGTAAPASVTLTVKPGTVSNTITITPGSTDCSPGICAGGDAVVAATISQGGNPLPARGVRFDVVSGDFLFITSPAGTTETLATNVNTVTDETGVARARLRASSNAANQVGILQVTDLGSGAFQRTTITLARTSTSQSGFFTVPTTIDYTGPDTANCAGTSSAPAPSSQVFIFGGAPPYSISNSAPGSFQLNTSVVGSTGGSFSVTPVGCATSAAIAITDAAGRTISVTLSNKPGTAAPITTLAVAPTSLGLNSCNATASAAILGGSGTFVAGDPTGTLTVTVAGRLLTVKRAPGPAPATSPVTVTVSDGTQSTGAGVTLSLGALGACP